MKNNPIIKTVENETNPEKTLEIPNENELISELKSRIIELEQESESSFLFFYKNFIFPQKNLFLTLVFFSFFIKTPIK